MRNVLLVAAALAVAIVAVSPPEASAQGCIPPSGWSTKAPIPTPIVRAWGQFFPGNGNFYAMGGRQTDVAGSDYVNPREYNPITNTWAVKAAAYPNLQVCNMVGGVLTLGGASVIVTVGGSAAGGTTATSETRTYNPVTDTLAVLATDPWPGNVGNTVLPGGGAVFNNKLYVFGGFNINVGMTTQIWQFDPALAAGARWTLKAASVPAPGLGYIPTATSGNFIYLLGGSAWDPTVLLVDTNSSLRYDPVADVITTVATIPRATAETRAVKEPNDGSIYVLSGGRTAPNPTTQVDVYHPLTNTWTTAPPILTARRNFPADVQSTDGRIWAVGGYNPTAPSAVNEQFTCVVPVDLMQFGVE
jgi:hypothetical protein